MKKIDRTILVETAYIAAAVLIFSMLMQSVFLIIGKWDTTVLFGNLLGGGAAVLNFFLMGLGVQKALGKEQKEAANVTELSKVTRVLYNRLDSDYTRLECDSTALYVKDLAPNTADAEAIGAAYNTYVRAGLTAGAICNPGLDALKAAVFPSDDAYVSACYYFANDTAGNTYYSKTFSQHVATCRKYKIGMYG